MAVRQRIGGLELEQDLGFQEKSWRVEHIGWAVMSLLLLLALAGLFGGGPLGQTKVERQGVNLQYDRFARYDTSTTLQVQMDPETGAQGSVQFWLASSYSDLVQVDSLSPEPEQVRFVEDGVIYEFAASEGAKPFQATLNVRPQRAGPLHGAVGPDSQSAVEFTQYVYP